VRAAQQQIDAVLMNIQMPNMDTEATRNIRKNRAGRIADHRDDRNVWLATANIAGCGHERLYYQTHQHNALYALARWTMGRLIQALQSKN
jgi:CheY-like chemotaxis protein